MRKAISSWKGAADDVASCKRAKKNLYSFIIWVLAAFSSCKRYWIGNWLILGVIWRNSSNPQDVTMKPQQRREIANKMVASYYSCLAKSLTMRLRPLWHDASREIPTTKRGGGSKSRKKVPLLLFFFCGWKRPLEVFKWKNITNMKKKWATLK